MFTLKEYLVTIGVFFSIDIFWLAFIAKKLYRKHLGFIMADKFNVGAAVLFYVVFIGGLLYFVIRPGIESGNIYKVALGGLIFGFVTYSTYDLTNLATLKDWPLIITIVDIIWGSILCSLVSTISYLILK